ncbi:MAG: GapA-binding peptide SR1P [Planifilum sp.]
MEVIVCQSCDAIVDYMETEKAGVLYGTCPGCQEKSSREERR